MARTNPVGRVARQARLPGARAIAWHGARSPRGRARRRLRRLPRAHGRLAVPAGGRLLRARARGQASALHEIRPDLPLPLCEIVTRALQSDPAARFPTALAMREALESWRGERSIEHGPEPVARCLNAALGPAINARNARIRAAFDRYVVSSANGATREASPG